jgi:hypothetical protein
LPTEKVDSRDDSNADLITSAGALATFRQFVSDSGQRNAMARTPSPEPATSTTDGTAGGGTVMTTTAGASGNSGSDLVARMPAISG